MKQEVLNRYERDQDGRMLIDISTESVENLYVHWDRTAPYIRRDLARDLTDYLIDCAEELEGHPFSIRFIFNRAVDQDSLMRVTKSINMFFHYLAEKERQAIGRMLRKSMLLFGSGLLVLFSAVWVNEWVGLQPSVWQNVFAQGLTVAAWVALWEALATFLIEWYPRRKQVRVYRNLASAPLSFRQAHPDAAARPS